jgi:hypothetical protein
MPILFQESAQCFHRDHPAALLAVLHIRQLALADELLNGADLHAEKPCRIILTERRGLDRRDGRSGLSLEGIGDALKSQCQAFPTMFALVHSRDLTQGLKCSCSGSRWVPRCHSSMVARHLGKKRGRGGEMAGARALTFARRRIESPECSNSNLGTRIHQVGYAMSTIATDLALRHIVEIRLQAGTCAPDLLPDLVRAAAFVDSLDGPGREQLNQRANLLRRETAPGTPYDECRRQLITLLTANEDDLPFPAPEGCFGDLCDGQASDLSYPEALRSLMAQTADYVQVVSRLKTARDYQPTEAEWPGVNADSSARTQANAPNPVARATGQGVASTAGPTCLSRRNVRRAWAKRPIFPKKDIKRIDNISYLSRAQLS